MSESTYRHAIGWVLLLLALGPIPLANADEHQKAVWIDTDPACGTGARADVDDCFALLYALRSPALRVVGISTVFGNTDLQTATETLHALLEQPLALPLGTATRLAVHAGASRARTAASPHGTPASEALATALRAERLTLIALGPLTNVATLIAHTISRRCLQRRIRFTGCWSVERRSTRRPFSTAMMKRRRARGATSGGCASRIYPGFSRRFSSR